MLIYPRSGYLSSTIFSFTITFFEFSWDISDLSTNHVRHGHSHGIPDSTLGDRQYIAWLRPERYYNSFLYSHRTEQWDYMYESLNHIQDLSKNNKHCQASNHQHHTNKVLHLKIRHIIILSYMIIPYLSRMSSTILQTSSPQEHTEPDHVGFSFRVEQSVNIFFHHQPLIL